jgi:hypothetical protein
MANNPVSVTELIFVVPSLLFVMLSVVAWIFGAYYMVRAMRHYHPDREWGKFLGPSIFSSYFFTEEGNRYRIKAGKAVALFVIFGFVSGAIIVVGSLSGVIRSS